MQNAPANWTSLFSTAHKTAWKFEIGNNSVVYQGSSIKGTPIITKPLMDTPCLGKVCSGSLVVSLYPSGTIAKGAAVNAYCRLESTDGETVTDWVPQGKYYVSSRSGKSPLTLTCYDRMLKAGQTYKDKTALTEWPQPMTSVVAEIATLMGVSIDGRTSIKTGTAYQVSYPNEDMLMSEVLGMIAVAHGGNWIMSEAGALRLVPLASATTRVSQDVGKSHTGFTLGGTTRTVSRVTLVDSAKNEFTSGNDTGMSLTASCDYATQSLATALCDSTAASGRTLYGVTYVPYELTGAYLDPLLELGDSISVSDKSGTATHVVLFSVKMYCTVSSACDVAASTKDENEDEFPYKSPTDLMLERVVRTDQTYYGNSLTRTNGFVSELLVNGEAKARTTANASTFAMQIYENGGWQNRIYFDAVNGKYVITGDVTLEGAVEFSDLSTQQEQTFIHGGNITTGTLSASKITTGVLQSSNGNLKFDLDTGLFTVGTSDLATALGKIDNALRITATSQIFTKADGATAYTPTSITLTAETSGSISTYQWYKDGSAISGATSNTLTVTADSISGNAATYKVVGTDSSSNTYSDMLTVAKVSDGHQGRDGDPGEPGEQGDPGESGYTVVLSDEYMEIPVGVGMKPTQAVNTTCSITVYKGLTALTFTAGTPTGDTYGISIVSTPTGITAQVNSSPAGVKVTASASTAIASGDIVLNITTGSGLTIPARITVQANLNSVVVAHDSSITTLNNQISLRVTETTYHTDIPIYSASDPSTSWTSAEKTAKAGTLWYDTANDCIKRWSGSAWETSFTDTAWASIAQSQIDLNAENIELKVSKNGVIAAINLSSETATISASKINLSGYVTVSGLSGGTTTIDGACIKTGTIGAEYLELSGAIAFSDLSDYSTVNSRISSASSTASSAYTKANSAYNLADSAYDNADAIADGTYTGGTFISGKILYSPTIYADEFIVKPKNSTSTGSWTGGYTMYGYYGSTLYKMLSIAYYEYDAPTVVFSSPCRGYAEWNFGQTYLEGSFDFRSGSTIDFSNCTCTGLSGATAVFG